MKPKDHIDQDAIDETDKLINKQLEKVDKLTTAVTKTRSNIKKQDVDWASELKKMLVIG